MTDLFRNPAFKLFAAIVVIGVMGVGCLGVVLHEAGMPLVPPSHPAGYDELMSAIDAKDFARTKAVLDLGFSPNTYPNSEDDQAYEDDIAPLDQAADDSSLEIVKLLLDRGADPNMGDGWHYNPLAAATSNERIDAMKLLVERGAAVNDLGGGSSSLWRAATDGKVESVKFLLAHGANPNTDMSGSLLDAVIELNGSPAVIKLLKEHGAKQQHVRN